MNETNGEIKIEKGIPIPDSHSRIAKYPWGSMEVGDSVLVTTGGVVSNASRRTGFKFTTRKVDATHTRIWRIA